MATRTTVKSGNLSDPTVWNGPIADNDTLVIAAAHVCTYDLDMAGAGWTLGVTLTINGELYFTTAQRTSLLLKTAIAGGGKLHVGTQAAPVQALGDGIPETATIAVVTDVAGIGSTLNMAEMWGEEREQLDTLAQPVLATDTALVLTNGLVLRAGDEVAVSHPTAGANSTRHFVAAYDAASKTVTLTAPLGRALAAGHFVCLLSTNILLHHIPVKSSTAAYPTNEPGTYSGVKFLNWVRGSNVAGMNFRYCVTDLCSAGLAYGGAGSSMVKCIGYGNYLIAGSAYNTTATDCVTFRSTTGVASTCVACTLIRCKAINQASGVFYTARASKAFDCETWFCSNYPLAYTCSGCYLKRCWSYASANYALGYFCDYSTFVDCGQDNTVTSLMGCRNCTFIGCLLAGTTEHNSSPSYFDGNELTESFDHDQVPNAYRAWSLGGIVDRVDDEVPEGHLYAMRHTTNTVNSPSIWHTFITVEPGDTVRLKLIAKRGAAACALKLHLLGIRLGPLTDPEATPLAELDVADPAQEWTTYSLEWTNTGDIKAQVRVRVDALSTVTANLWFKLEIDMSGFTDTDRTNLGNILARLPVEGAAKAADLQVVVNPTPVTVEPTPVTVNPTVLDPAERTAIATAVWGATTRTLSSFGTLAADTATAVWNSATRTLTGFGTLVQSVWEYATRTLSDKTGFSLSQADKDALRQGLAEQATSLEIKSKTDALPAQPAAAGEAAAAVAPVEAKVDKVKAATYDTMSWSGDKATLSNGAEQTFTEDGRTTVEP